MNRLLARRREENGQTLLLALGFMTLFGVICAGLLNFAFTNLRSSISLRDVRGVQFAADGAVDTAINRARFDTTAGFPIQNATGCLPTTTFNNQSLYVDCSASVSGSVSTVTLLACRSSVSSPCPASSAVLRAQVAIDRSPLPGCPVNPIATSPQCTPITVKAWSVSK